MVKVSSFTRTTIDTSVDGRTMSITAQAYTSLPTTTFITENWLMARNTGLECINSKMEIIITEIGNLIEKMAKEYFITIKLEENMMENGERIISMVMESTPTPTMTTMKATGTRIKSVDKAPLCLTKQRPLIEANGITIWPMGKALLFMKAERNIKDFSKTTKRTDLEHFQGKMIRANIIMKAIGLTTREMVEGCTNIKMAIFMRVIG